MKGKQLWLVEDIDLKEMYELFKKKHEFSLWCFIQKNNPEDTRNNRKRRSNSTSDITPQSKLETCAQTLNKVEEIVKKLQDNHGATYSVEQFNIWAHMLHIQKHCSYEVPPSVFPISTSPLLQV